MNKALAQVQWERPGAIISFTLMVQGDDFEDGNQLVAWANANDIGLLAFWSVGRDNGGCPGGGVSPSCSSISQSQYQFTNIFRGFTG